MNYMNVIPKNIKRTMAHLHKQITFTFAIEGDCWGCKNFGKCKGTSNWRCTKFNPIFKIRKCILRRCRNVSIK